MLPIIFLTKTAKKHILSDGQAIEIVIQAASLLFSRRSIILRLYFDLNAARVNDIILKNY